MLVKPDHVDQLTPGEGGHGADIGKGGGLPLER